MKKYLSDSLPPLSGHEQELVYCGLDSAVTLELLQHLEPSLGEARPIYEHGRRLLAPYLTMMSRGIKVDTAKLEVKKPLLAGKIAELTTWFRDMAEACLSERPNEKIVNSPLQLKRLFYEALAIPTLYKLEKGQRKIALDRKALEKIRKKYLRGAAPAGALLRIRDTAKTLSTLESGLRNSRWHCSYNLAGTETWRRSSSEHPLGYGDNLQNKARHLRELFISDEGFTLAQADQAQAEARDVAYLSGDEGYLHAVNGPDLHTTVAAMVWGFEARRDLADRKLYREKSYRDIVKNIGYASNYDGTPPTLANLYGIELPVIEDFHQRYHLGPNAAFPGIKRWQDATVAEAQHKGYLETCFGYRRQFWGRLGDDSTMREAIAFRPQNMTGARTAIALWKLYWELEPSLQLLQEGHDSILFQVPEGSDLLPAVKKCLEVPCEITDIQGATRTQLVPWETKTGKNWRDRSEENPEGLK